MSKIGAHLLKQSDQTAPQCLAFKDPKSFEEVYALHWKRIYAVCYNNVKVVEIAQEMTQDIFLSLWERRDTLVITSSIEHYLVRAAKMKVFEYIRNKTIHETHLREVEARTISSTLCTEQEVVYKNLSEHVQTLIHHLPFQSQRIYSLRETGSSNKEIAGILKISEKAVEYHTTKILRFLQENMRFVFDS